MQSKYSYYIEPFELKERPRRFLQTFAAILQNTNYGPVLDFYTRLTTKCANCTVAGRNPKKWDKRNRMKPGIELSLSPPSSFLD